jgi:hypothetical protein
MGGNPLMKLRCHLNPIGGFFPWVFFPIAAKPVLARTSLLRMDRLRWLRDGAWRPRPEFFVFWPFFGKKYTFGP